MAIAIVSVGFSNGDVDNNGYPCVDVTISVSTDNNQAWNYEILANNVSKISGEVGNNTSVITETISFNNFNTKYNIEVRVGGANNSPWTGNYKTIGSADSDEEEEEEEIQYGCYVWNAGSWRKAIPYVWNAGGWRKAIPYVWNAGGWRPTIIN